MYRSPHNSILLLVPAFFARKVPRYVCALRTEIAEAAAPRLQILNPNVQIQTETSDPEQLGDEFFKQFDVVCVLGLAAKSSFLERVNRICRADNIKFYSGGIYGFHGHFFTDLGSEYSYVIEESKNKLANVSIDDGADNSSTEPSAKKSKPSEEANGDDSTKMVKQCMEFAPWARASNPDWSCGASARTIRRTSPIYFVMLILQNFIDHHGRSPATSSHESDFKEICSLRDSILKKLQLADTVVPNDLLRQCIAELSPVCAIVGGVLGQEVIKAVSGKDAPLNNFFLYHGVQGNGMVEKLGYS
ncbi:SUMO-activating enzyme subunit 1-like isoform X2 [Sycon ciliatum]|uniref:SUMO-activating enzyme subunit 1-like isoform X2 n=1 Tax=Sycon ciliatum TaxID=27933 RepID=UPI0020AAC8C4|eukprot:scpid11739/ scgid4140/ SUMO-activating enzyme subunit 1; SUMO-activating enzyme E1 N subunit; Ubiquitin-like 1-activating enzyme E1A